MDWGANSVMSIFQSKFQAPDTIVTMIPCGTMEDAVPNKLKPRLGTDKGDDVVVDVDDDVDDDDKEEEEDDVSDSRPLSFPLLFSSSFGNIL